jgi:hypothetical protein
MNVMMLQQMELCKLRLVALEMKRQNPVGLLRELVSRRPTQKQVQLLQILRALKLSLIFPLVEIGIVLRGKLGAQNELTTPEWETLLNY